MERILRVTNYPNLYGLGLYEIDMENAISLFIAADHGRCFSNGSAAGHRRCFSNSTGGHHRRCGGRVGGHRGYCSSSAGGNR
ncbi:unnamed protein product [Rotaria sp. Silwood1]|nr:unnamed protein product [Rotaria sp. Silwood1]